MEYNSPLGAEKEQTLISILNLPNNANVLEIGCGNGKLLLKIIDKYQAQGIGFDLNTNLIELANSQAKNLSNESQARFLTQDINTTELENNHYDLVICNGSSHALGSGQDAYENTLRKAHELLKPGGLLLIGEGYWKQPPSDEYLAFIGEPVGVYHDFRGNVVQAREHGFELLYATSSNQDEWDNFEWSHKLKNRKLLQKSPNDEQLLARKQHIDRWLDGYLKWGRDTMGYGFYVFEKPHL